MAQLPETGFVRLAQIIGQSEVTEKQAAENRRTGSGPRRVRPGIPALISVRKSSWWDGVRTGRYPKPTKALGPRTTAWNVEDIRRFIEKAAG